jgi:hypothetical protein
VSAAPAGSLPHRPGGQRPSTATYLITYLAVVHRFGFVLAA